MGWSAINLLGVSENPFLVSVPPTVNETVPTVAMVTGPGLAVWGSSDGINYTRLSVLTGSTNDKPIAFRAQWENSGPFVIFDTAFVGTDSNKSLNITNEQTFF